MNSQHCRVGKISASEYIMHNLKQLEEQYINFVDEAYSIMETDQSLSDFLYYEASQLKRKILTLRKFI